MKPFYRPIQLAALALSMVSGCAASTDLSTGDVDSNAEPLSVPIAMSCPIFGSCFFVTNTSDSGAGSLRQAIVDANAAGGIRRIHFNIPGAGPHVIQPVQPLPMLLGDTTIAGYSQPGTARATDTTPPQIEIVINGLFSTAFWGLNLGIGGNVVEGVAINDFVPGSGIVVSSDNNVIRGNMLGVDRDATFARPNAQAGVNINVGTGNVIGGAAIEDRNVISGNGVEGVVIFGEGNEVYGNAIGTSFDGSVALPNGASGVAIYGEGANEIGGTGDGEGNIIAWNEGDGITVFDGTENTLSRNSLHDNGGLGIDLAGDGVTRNDGLLDLDVGPNALQNFPQLESVTLDPATEYDGRYKAEVTWHLKSEANTKYRVEFFASAACDPSGHGEAERSLGSRAINSDATGLVENVWILPGRVGPGEVITATATKFVDVGATYSATETSELSRCLLAELCTGTSCEASAPDDDR